MKKKYVTPNLLSVNVETAQLVCASLENGGHGSGRPANMPHKRSEDSEEDYEEAADSWTF